MSEDYKRIMRDIKLYDLGIGDKTEGYDYIKKLNNLRYENNSRLNSYWNENDNIVFTNNEGIITIDRDIYFGLRRSISKNLNIREFNNIGFKTGLDIKFTSFMREFFNDFYKIDAREFNYTNSENYNKI